MSNPMETPQQRPQLRITESYLDDKKIPLEMYEISGQDKITEHSFSRYIKDQEQDEKIKSKVQDSAFSVKEKMKNASPEEIISLIKKSFDDPNPQVRKVATDEMFNVPKTEVESLIEEGLKNSNSDVKEAAALMMWSQVHNLSQSEKLPIIRKLLDNPNPRMQRIAAREIQEVEDQEKGLLEEILLEKIKDGFANQNSEIQIGSSLMIQYAPEKDRSSLIKEGLNSVNLETKKTVIKMIYLLSSEEKIQLIKEGLKNKDIEIQKAYIEKIGIIPTEERTLLIKEALNSSNSEIQETAARMVHRAPPEEQSLLHDILLSKIQECLNNQTPENHKFGIEMMKFLTPKEKESVFQIILEKGLNDEFVAPKLYNKTNTDNKNFKREVFYKTGSETTLLGGELKNKTIIRHMEAASFLVWKNLFENYELWQQSGFDYVPIEPIQSYKSGESGLVDVFSGVLDLSLRQWSDRSDKFISELKDQKKKILDVLNKTQTSHRDAHDGNFCLRFFRDENGNVDFHKTPRLYLIDFDDVVSS